jgi:hypothetical protein
MVKQGIKQMPSFLNESFAHNMTGKTVKFDMQPYARGTMVLTNIVERAVTVEKEFHPERGGMRVTYNVFDIEGDVIEGTETGALICGVPVPGSTRKLSTYRMIGVTRGQLYRACFEDATIIKVAM